MAIGFVIGRAGTGKTRHCLGEIKKLLEADPMGPPIFWIVPRQITFSTERLLLAEVGAFSRCRILSFDKLGDEVLGATGGVATTAISARGRQMILGLLLRQNQARLTYFSSSARHVGLARELDRTFTELERSGSTSAELVETLIGALQADPTDADTQTLLNKARDINLLYVAYTDFLGDRLDTHRRLERVLQMMCDCPTFKNSHVFVDAFTDFTRHERQMIVGLAAACTDVTVTLLMDPASPLLKDFHKIPDELCLFHKTERHYGQLMIELADRKVKVRPVTKLTAPRRFTAKSLTTIEKSAFDQKEPTAISLDHGLERITAPDRAAEVDAVARRVLDLLHDGARLRDILVLVRDLSQYQHLIATSFREHGLQFFVDVRRPAMHHPLLQWLRAIFAIARRKWQSDDVIALLKTGLAGVSLDEADEVENYCLQHGLTGEVAWEQADAWAMVRGMVQLEDSDEMIEVDGAEPSRIDKVRQELLTKLRPFLDVVLHQPRLTFKQIAVALFKLMDRFQVRPKIDEWIKAARDANQLEVAAEHEQTWSSLVELFDELVDLLGPHEVSFDDFVQTLEAGLEQFDFALTPPTLDQIEVGEIDRSRAVDTKTAFVLGLAEGSFPMVSSEQTVLTDTDRGLLRRRSIELDDDTTRRLLDERFLGYLAFTRSSERLILTRPSSDTSGKPLNASPFWDRLGGLFTDLDAGTSLAPCYAHDKPGCIATPRQLVTGLMRWARREGSAVTETDPTWSALYDALARRAVTSDVAIKLRHQAWPALSYKNDAVLSPAVAGELFPSPLQATVSRIETFAACPFKHFAQYGLQLKSREVRDFSFADAGMAYHRILDEIVTDLLKTKSHWKDLTDDQAVEKIAATAAAVVKDLHNEVFASSARNRYLFKRIERTLAQVIASQRALADHQSLRPSRAGVKFGSAGDKLQSPLIETPKKRTVHLHGRIDRIDQVPGQPLFSIVDYKSGKSELRLQDVYHGLAMQLLAYMLVLRENKAGKQITPIGAFYYKVTRSLQRADHPSEVAEPGTDEFNLAIKPRGILHADFVSEFDLHLQTGNSLAVNVSRNKDNSLGRRESSDAADAAELDKLLDYVRDKIAILSDELMSGVVKVEPYRLGEVTPCPRCPYRSVCRFEVGINKHHTLQVMKRSAVMEAITGQGGGDV